MKRAVCKRRRQPNQPRPITGTAIRLTKDSGTAQLYVVVSRLLTKVAEARKHSNLRLGSKDITETRFALEGVLADLKMQNADTAHGPGSLDRLGESALICASNENQSLYTFVALACWCVPSKCRLSHKRRHSSNPCRVHIRHSR